MSNEKEKGVEARGVETEGVKAKGVETQESQIAGSQDQSNEPVLGSMVDSSNVSNSEASDGIVDSEDAMVAALREDSRIAALKARDKELKARDAALKVKDAERRRIAESHGGIAADDGQQSEELDYNTKRIMEANMSAATLVGWKLLKGGSIQDPQGVVHEDRLSAVPQFSKDMQIMFDLFVPKFSSFEMRRQNANSWHIKMGSPNQMFEVSEHTPEDALITAAALLANATGLTREQAND